MTVTVSLSARLRLHPLSSHSFGLLASTALFGGGLLLTALQVSAADAALEAAAPQAENKSDTADSDEATDLDKVVVRSRNRLEPLKDVPVSISVVTGKDLTEQAGYDLSAVSKRAANVARNNGNSRTYSMSIRGLGKVGQTEAQDPSVGIIEDGISFAYNPLGSFDFYDVDTVEVARGPQGTLLGKNTTMGAVNITNKRPSFTSDANYSLLFGEHQTIIGTVNGGGAVIDDLLAWRGSLIVDKGRGQIHNQYNPDQTWFNSDRVSGRVQLLFTPSENFNARLSVQVQPQGSEYYNSGVFYTPTPSTYSDGVATNLGTDASTRLARRWFTQNPNYSYTGNYLSQSAIDVNAQQPLVTYTDGASAELNWTLGSYTLTSITGYRDYHFQARNDDGTPFDITVNSGGKVDQYKQVSEELRVSSAVGGFLDYQGGLYLFSNGVDYAQQGWTNGYGADAGAWYATTTQYNTLDVAINSDSSTSGGRYLLTNSLNGLNKAQPQHIRNESEALFGQANWHLSDPLTITTGARLTHEHRTNTTSSVIVDNGVAPELNPVQVNGVQLGGFDSNATTGALTGANTAQQIALANATALKYFGVASYSSLTTVQLQQVAAAKAIRKSQIGVLWNSTPAQSFDKTQPAWVISPSYKINAKLTTYVSWQHGEKAGISQAVNGVSYLAKPEKTNSFELGTKSVLFNRSLVFNADIFLMNIQDFQQAVLVYDEYTTTLNNDGTFYYTSATGNVPKVQVKGLEIDGSYSGIPHTTLRFSGAYNDAKYKQFPNSAQPVEYDTVKTATYTPAPYRDVSGQQVAGAAKVTFNVGVDYRQPVFDSKEFHAAVNTAYTSRYNSDISLSDYAWIDASYVTDFDIGLGRRDGKFDVKVVAKNLFNNQTPQAKTWNTITPAVGRWWGIQFNGKL
jgi:iron complex outermembrane receptor protein